MQITSYSTEFVIIILSSNSILLAIVAFFLSMYIKSTNQGIKEAEVDREALRNLIESKINGVYSHFNVELEKYLRKDLCDERRKHHHHREIGGGD